MTKHRTIHALLAVVALLLALNLAAALPWPTAQAQEPQVWPPPPLEVVQISGVGYHTGSRSIDVLYRLWSDGTIESNAQHSSCPNWCGWRVVPDP